MSMANKDYANIIITFNVCIHHDFGGGGGGEAEGFSLKNKGWRRQTEIMGGDDDDDDDDQKTNEDYANNTKTWQDGARNRMIMSNRPR